MKDRVTVENFGNQRIPAKTWTQLVANDGSAQYAMPTGDTNIDVWVSFNQPTATSKPKHLQFVTVRRDGTTHESGFPGITGNCTGRSKVVLGTGDLGLTYHWGLYSDGTPLAVFVYQDGTADITIDGYEAHYKHVPEVVVS